MSHDQGGGEEGRGWAGKPCRRVNVDEGVGGAGMTRLRQSMQCSMFRLGVFVFFAFNNKKRSLSRR